MAAFNPWVWLAGLIGWCVIFGIGYAVWYTFVTL